MPLNDFMTVGEVAEELGLSPVSVRGAIRRGVLKGRMLDRRTWVVPRSEVERYRKENLGKRGRRPTK